MKKFLKWFIGIIIVAAIAFGVCKYMGWCNCDNTCDTPVTEEVITDEDVATEIAEDAVEIDTMIGDTAEEVADTIQNTPVEVVNE
jgi:hypothetical protein